VSLQGAERNYSLQPQSSLPRQRTGPTKEGWAKLDDLLRRYIDIDGCEMFDYVVLPRLMMERQAPHNE